MSIGIKLEIENGIVSETLEKRHRYFDRKSGGGGGG